MTASPGSAGIIRQHTASRRYPPEDFSSISMTDASSPGSSFPCPSAESARSRCAGICSSTCGTRWRPGSPRCPDSCSAGTISASPAVTLPRPSGANTPWLSQMSRRKFLRAGVAAMSMAVPYSWALRAAAAPAGQPGPLKQRGAPQPFDYARLKGLAKTLAEAPYKAPPDKLPPAIAQLDWDHWQSIRFRDEHSLWAGDGLRFRIQFAHLGFRSNKPVRMYLVQDGQAQEIAFDPA